MHLTKADEGRLDRSQDWGGEPAVRLTWLIDSALGDSDRGAVARMRIEPGGGQPAHSHPSAEEATVVLAGSGSVTIGGEELALRPGNVLYAPVGALHAIRAGAEPLDLLLTISANDAGAAGWEEGAGPAGAGAARLLSGREVDEQELNDAAIGFLGMHARWLVDGEICGSGSIVVGNSRFAPEGGVHELHRHPQTAEFFIVLDGEHGVQLEQDGSEVPVAPGDAALLGRGSWHGFRNNGSEELHAVFGFLSATSLDDAGYELPEG
jgi:quercetin dioxygenase-like cupin family protein